MKFTPLLPSPPAVTTTLPEVAPDGTVTKMLDGLQLVTAAPVPLKVTEPTVVPKFDPAMVTDEPTAPEFGDRLVIFGGAAATEKFNVTFALLTVVLWLGGLKV